jgi:hypothetical protein
MRKITDVTLRITFDDERQSVHPLYWDWVLFVNQQNVNIEPLKALDRDDLEKLVLSLETISPADLSRLMFGDSKHWHQSPLSVHTSDSPIQRIKILSPELGRFIAELDPNEEFFHVEFFGTTHSEVWSALAWRESLTRRLRHNHQHSTDVNDLVALKQHVIAELTQIIGQASREQSHKRAEQTAIALVQFGDINDIILELVNAPLELRAKLFKLRALITDATQQSEQEQAT